MKKIKYIYLCVFLLITLSAYSVFTTQQSEYDRNNSNIEEKILTNSNPINSNYISFTASEQISEKEITSRCSGLSPYRLCPCWAHTKKRQSMTIPEFISKK